MKLLTANSLSLKHIINENINVPKIMIDIEYCKQ